MADIKHASIYSQLGTSECEAEDTEDMFWLRESDDYQSCMALGNALAGQYRLKEAVEIYEKARSIRQDDAMLYIRLGGANLSLFRFEEAKAHYESALRCGSSIQSVSYPLGVWHYLKGNYQTAADCFSRCIPCSGEMKIAIIYWHTLSSYRAGIDPELLEQYDSGMDVGHHLSYKTVVSVFCGERSWDDISVKENALDATVILYGISIYLEHLKQAEKARQYADQTLKYDSVWPCIPYLAAWNDKKHH